MKKSILLFLGTISASLFTQAQSLQLLQLSDNMPAASSYTFMIAVNDPTSTYDFIVKNASSSSISAEASKNIHSAVSGQDIYFCFGPTCYTPITDTSSAISIAAGAEIPDHGANSAGLRTDFDNNGIAGTTVVNYKVYNTSNPNDSASVTITYIVNATGINTYSKQVFVSNASPNPNQGSFTLNYNLNGESKNATLSIYNMLGANVKNVSIPNTETSAKIDVSELQEGIYFYTLNSASGKISTTRKFVVEK